MQQPIATLFFDSVLSSIIFYNLIFIAVGVMPAAIGYLFCRGEISPFDKIMSVVANINAILATVLFGGLYFMPAEEATNTVAADLTDATVLVMSILTVALTTAKILYNCLLTSHKRGDDTVIMLIFIITTLVAVETTFFLTYILIAITL